MTKCFHCGATVDSGLALCDLCQRKVRTDLQYLPVYFNNLTRWKPGRAGSRPVPSSRIPAGVLPAGEDRVGRVVDEAEVGLIAWADCLADDRPGHLSRVIARILATDEQERRYRLLCNLFDRHLSSIATLEWCGEFVRVTAEAEAHLRRLTEQVVPGWYAGACRGSGGVVCGANTYVVPGLTWVTCTRCGVTTAARDHLPVILDEARAWVAPPKRIAEALVALLDTEVSVPRLHKRISKWGERGHGNGGIDPIRRMDRDGDPFGPKRVRFGEVFDLLRERGATRIEAKTYRKSA